LKIEFERLEFSVAFGHFQIAISEATYIEIAVLPEENPPNKGEFDVALLIEELVPC
jgi:hypothetical protein